RGNLFRIPLLRVPLSGSKLPQRRHLHHPGHWQTDARHRYSLLSGIRGTAQLSRKGLRGPSEPDGGVDYQPGGGCSIRSDHKAQRRNVRDGSDFRASHGNLPRSAWLDLSGWFRDVGKTPRVTVPPQQEIARRFKVILRSEGFREFV